MLLLTKRVHALFLACCLVIVSVLPVVAKEQQKARLRLEPFVVHSQQDKSFLRTAVRSMVASRLAASGRCDIVEGKADFVLLGELTAIGKGLSLHVTVRDLSEGQPPASYVSSAASEDAIIAAVDELADKIVQGSFAGESGKVAAPVSAQLVPAAPQPTPAVTTAHPDHAFRQTKSGVVPSTAAAPAGGAAIIRPQAQGAGGKTLNKTQNVKLALHDMVVADVDGDGRDEVVLAEKFEATVYRFQGQRLSRMATLSLSTQFKIAGLFGADLDNDGRAEIYLSGVKGTQVQSLAAQWQDGAWDYRFKGQSWYVRPLAVPGRGLVLVGQGAGMSQPFAGPVTELSVIEGKLQPSVTMALPPKAHIFNFSLANLDGTGDPEVVLVDESDYLRVMRSSGKLLWKSDDRFGGSIRFVGGQDTLRHRGGRPGHQEVDLIDGEELRRIYLPTPIVVQDLNGDGLDEVVVVKNGDSATRFLQNMKRLPSGEVMALGWNGLALTELWRTQKLDGYVASYDLRPGSPETKTLYVGLVLSRSLDDIFAAKESTVLLLPVK